MKKQLIYLILLSIAAAGCSSNSVRNKMKLNLFEYSRGMSLPVRSDLAIKYEDNDYVIENMLLDDQSFFEDNSIIPNAFIKPLFRLDLDRALKAFTEPYYSYRFVHFFKSNPNIGIGVEFIHLKIFLMDEDQKLRMRGTFRGEEIDKIVRVGDYLDLFNISHGVNHAGIHIVYRWMLSQTESIPDGKFQPYVNFSFGPTIPHLELNTIEEDGVKKRAYSYQAALNNFSFGLGTGIRYKPWNNFGIYLEYKVSYSYLKGMHFDDITGTRVNMDFLTHHLQWGISFMF